MEWRKHGEFELEAVSGRDDEGRVVRGCVFGEFDIEGLGGGCQYFLRVGLGSKRKNHTTSFLIR